MLTVLASCCIRFVACAAAIASVASQEAQQGKLATEYPASTLAIPSGSKHEHRLYHRVYQEQNWLISLAWNLVGYATVIVPAWLLVRMIKNSNFNEREGLGCLFKFIQLCVFGTPDTPSDDASRKTLPNRFSTGSSYTIAGKLIFCAVGLQVAYLSWGVLQERIMTKKYGEGDSATTFKDSQFLVFMNRLLALIVSGLSMLLCRQRSHKAPFYKYSYASLSNILSSWCQYEALKFVSFPTQVLGKASKMIPVMLMGRVVSKRSYQYYEYVIATLISVGVTLFLMSVASGKHNSAETTMSGLLLMIGYMGFDSFTSNWQSQMFQEFQLTSLQMMFGTNVFSSLFTCISLLQSGGLISAIQFIYHYPTFGYHALAISFASALGQLFIFYTISSFGPLVFTTIMVTRQMFSILLSCIIYQHSLAPQAILGVCTVFIALFLQVYAKWRLRKIQLQRAAMQSEV